ncbi:MAG: localization factor PodJL [Hyphobacterium sp.]|nr:MAG: localization factor PodJL [Hyphobacterium sp.]
MSSAGPWSVKGIDPRARARAKSAARREGMTLGEWLNTVILDGGASEDGSPGWENNLEAFPGFARRNDEGDALLRGMVERLTERIESTERQSSSLLNEVDRSLSDLAERVETTDMSYREDREKTRELAEAARSAAEALALRVKRIEESGGTADPQTLKTFEAAFGKLAARVFRNETDGLQSAEIMQSALDEFGQATEKATLSLQKRIEAIESGQARLADDVRKTSDRTQGTGRVLHGLHDAAERLRRRVDESERLANDAASAFEQSISRIDTRLRSLETRPLSLETGDIDRRFEILSDELASVVADTRSQMARELESVASEPRVERLERALKSAETRITAAETSHSESLSRIGLEITRLARVMDDRITESERKTENLHKSDKSDREMDRRFDAVRNENRDAIRKLGDDVSALGQSLNERVAQSETRAAEAIETATKSMSEAVGRLEERQSRVKDSDLDERLRQSEERTAKRIEDAISGISERLEKARTDTEESLSPVQRAMNALADRLEAIEGGKPSEQTPDAPVATPSLRATPIDEPDFDTALPPPPDAETPPGFDDDEVDDPFIIAEAAPSPGRHQTRAAVEDEFLAADEAGNNASADAGMILQPMEPVDEPARRPAQRPAAQAAPKPRAALGATADADFLAAARSRTRGDRSTSFDPYVTEDGGSTGGRTFMIAASVLGFVAIASAAGMLLYDNFNNAPASAAEAFAADVLNDLDTQAVTSRTENRPSSQPSDTARADVTEQPVETPVETSQVETSPVPTQTDVSTAALDRPTPESTPRELNLQASTEQAVQPAAAEPVGPVTITLPTLQEAASSGDPIARYLLGEERLSAGDVAGAVALIRRAAEQNVSAAQYRYARLLERGQGVEPSPVDARRWALRAAEAGHLRAMHNVASMYATGHGGEEDIEAAARWFEEAALRGLTDSQYNLAILFQMGQGMPQSAADAYAWFSIAAAGGDTGAGQQAAAIASTLDTQSRMAADQVVASFTPRPIDAEVNGRYDRNWGTTITIDTDLIASAQTLLNALGYDAGLADGQPGPRTEAAVRAFQSDRQLPPTGVIDQALIGRLENARSG